MGSCRGGPTFLLALVENNIHLHVDNYTVAIDSGNYAPLIPAMPPCTSICHNRGDLYTVQAMKSFACMANEKLVPY